MKLLRYLQGVLGGIIIFLSGISIVGAQPSTKDPWDTPPVQAGGVSTAAGLIALISQALKWAQYFLYSGAAILGIMAAYQFLTSRGDAEKTKGAQNTILYAIIAVVVGLIAGGIGPIILEMFGK